MGDEKTHRLNGNWSTITKRKEGRALTSLGYISFSLLFPVFPSIPHTLYWVFKNNYLNHREISKFKHPDCINKEN